MNVCAGVFEGAVNVEANVDAVAERKEVVEERPVIAAAALFTSGVVAVWRSIVQIPSLLSKDGLLLASLKRTEAFCEVSWL